MGGSKKKDKTTIKAIKAEVYSRVVGYYRPIQAWHVGKKEEFKDREYVDIKIK